MKLTIHIHHTISIDDDTKEFIKSLFPNFEKLEDATKSVKAQTEKLKTAVDTNTPTT